MTLPTGPDPRLVPFAPAATRELRVFGAPVTLALLPSRKQRQDRPGAARPAFRPSPVARILAEEALWQDGELAVTPNRYPFAAEQRILWPKEPRRDPGVELWRAAAEWVDAVDGTGLLNNVGAASSIARAHVHLTPERLPFLGELAFGAPPALATALDPLPDVDVQMATSVPCCLLAVRGPLPARAAAIVALADRRLTAAWNVVLTRGTAWLFPRRLEVPASGFPYALGAAEVWGRWCYVDEAPFAAATAAMLEQALVTAGCPPLGP